MAPKITPSDFCLEPVTPTPQLILPTPPAIARQACHNKQHRLHDLNNRDLFSHMSAGRSPRSRCLQSWIHQKPFLSLLVATSEPCPHKAPLCVLTPQALTVSLRKTPALSDKHPTHVNSLTSSLHEESLVDCL